MKIVILHAAGGEHGTTALGTPDGRWVLLNVSAAAAQQLMHGGGGSQHPGLQRAEVRAVMLTDAQIEHAGGLLALRDGAPIDLYATPAVFEELTHTLPVLPVLQHYCGVHWRVVPVAGDQPVATFFVQGMPTLEFTAIATRLPPPAYSARTSAPAVGDSIALAVRDLSTGQRVFCAPGLATVSDIERDWMQQADCLLLDGPPGAGSASAAEPAAAPAGLAAAEAAAGAAAPGDAPAWAAAHGTAHHPRCADLLPLMPARHKVLYGASQTPPGQRHRWARQGIALAYDGMEIEL